MALNFPSNPTLNQIYTGPLGQKWKWNGEAWISFNEITIVPTASLALAGSGSFTGNFIGSLQGTASWAINAVTASTSANVIGASNQIAFFNSSNSITSSANLQFSNNNVGLTGSLTIRSSNTEAINLGTSATGLDQPVDIRLATGNARGIRIYASDNELTVTPNGAGFQFFSNNSVNFPGQVYFDSAANDNAAIILRTSQTGQIIQERMRITSAGNVLIGTPTPSGFKLDVNGTGRFSGDLTISSPNYLNLSFVKLGGSVNAFGLDYAIFEATTPNTGISMVAKSKGNPSGYGYAFQFEANKIFNSLLFVGDNATQAHYIHTDSTNSGNGWPLIFGVTPTGQNWNTTARLLVLTPTQRVGINTLSPSTTLDVSGSGRFTGGLTVTGSLNAPVITGSLHGTASWAQNAVNANNAATASNILGGKAPHVPYFITDTTLATSSIYQSGSTSVIINQDANTLDNPEALYVWQPNPTSINVISGKGNLDNYLQLNIQNTNQGPDASSDIVATANNGNESVNYIDMGINSQNYAGFLGGPNDAYLYSAGENLWIGNYSDGKSVYFFNSSSENPLITLTPSNTVDVNTTLNAPDITGSLYGTASWAQNTISSSHAVNSDFAGYAQAAGIAANGGVTQLIAGSGITLLPGTGVGNVTVIAGGGGSGVTILSGSNVTESFQNASTWAFTHSLGTRTPVISVFDSNYNQVIPESIQLVDTASAIITFPTLESGFAVATVGGVSGNALSASYSLFSTYADTASYYIETDPVFVARSASLATTGSNVFRGNQTISGNVTITGSLTVSGSNTFTKIGPSIFSGSVNITGSTTQTGNNTLIGNTVLSGSIGISGSSTIQGITTMSGSLNISGSTTQRGSNTLIGTTTLTGSILINGDIIPEVSSSFDLGSETNPWRSIYVQSGSISIQSDIPGGIPAVISNANGNVTIAGAGLQLKTGSFVPFEVTSTARTVIRVPNLPVGDIGGLSIIGSSTGAYQPVTNAGGLLHLTSNDEQSARLTVDAFGSGSFVSYVNRKARGTAASPLPVQAGDVMFRMATVGWTGNGYGISTPGVAAATTFEIVALDNFTTSSIGSRMHFYNAPSGSVTRTLSATIDTTGITIPSSSRLFGTASWAINAQTASFLPVGTYNVTASWAVSASQAVSASFASTASYVLNAVSSSFASTASYVVLAQTASYVLNAQTASYVLNAVSSSFASTASFVRNAQTASYVLNAVSSSFASTASYINPLNQNVIITGSLRVSGSLTEIGNAVFSGSVTLNSGSALNINDGFYVNGNKQFNYAQFANTASVPVTANVSASFALPLAYHTAGVSVVSQSRITFANTGLYNIHYSATALQGNTTPNLRLWFKKTGSNIDNSGVLIQLQNNTQTLITSQFSDYMNAGEYVELWYNSSNNNTSFPYTAAGSGFPATPSIIVSVTQIA